MPILLTCKLMLGESVGHWAIGPGSAGVYSALPQSTSPSTWVKRVSST